MKKNITLNIQDTDKAILQDLNSVPAIRLYWYLASHSCHLPSDSQIQETFGFDISEFNEGWYELEEKGYITELEHFDSYFHKSAQKITSDED